MALEVPRRALGEVGEFIRGNGLQKADLKDHGVPAIHYGQIHTQYGVWITETISFVAAELASRLRKARTGDLVVATTSEDDLAVGKATAWLGTGPVAVGGDAFIYRHELLPKFVSYFFQSDDFHRQKRRYISGAKVRRLSGDSLAKIRIPVPPIDVQQEIVRTLDAFSALEAALEAELEGRRKQYEHYRDRLLAFPEAGGVRRIRMGSVASIVRGASPRPIRDYLTHSEKGIPWIKIGDVQSGGKYITGTAESITLDGAAKSRRVFPGDFVLSNSMSFGRPYISRIEGCIHDGWLALSDFETTFDADFLYHLLGSSVIQKEFARRAGSGTVQNLNAEIVRSVVLPVPPLIEQRRISRILDRLEAFTNDYARGLPAEITARRKQYEYYRDKLLTFEEAS